MASCTRNGIATVRRALTPGAAAVPAQPTTRRIWRQMPHHDLGKWCIRRAAPYHAGCGKSSCSPYGRCSRGLFLAQHPRYKAPPQSPSVVAAHARQCWNPGLGKLLAVLLQPHSNMMRTASCWRCSHFASTCGMVWWHSWPQHEEVITVWAEPVIACSRCFNTCMRLMLGCTICAPDTHAAARTPDGLGHTHKDAVNQHHHSQGLTPMSRCHRHCAPWSYRGRLGRMAGW